VSNIVLDQFVLTISLLFSISNFFHVGYSFVIFKFIFKNINYFPNNTNDG
jgi:hypothetical protein